MENQTVDKSYRDKWLKSVNYFNLTKTEDDLDRGIIKDKDNNPKIGKDGKVKYYQKNVVVDKKVQYQDAIKIVFEHSDDKIMPQSLSVIDMQDLQTHAKSKDRVLQLAPVVDKDSGEEIAPISEYRLSWKSKVAKDIQVDGVTKSVYDAIYIPGTPRVSLGSAW